MNGLWMLTGELEPPMFELNKLCTDEKIYGKGKGKLILGSKGQGLKTSIRNHK